jgi:anti-sigma regulatory factor (Ser/Thr protein kinase)
LIVYTDGLIEVTRDITEGEGRLVQAARSTANVPSALAVRFLLERVLAGAKPFDDIALLMIDALPSNAPLAFSLAAVPENLRRLRHVVRAYAARVGIAREHADEILLAVGEAALNVVEHAYRGAQGTLTVRGNRLGEILTITVSDTGRWRQARERGRGRGTRIMNALSGNVKTVTGSTGTVVEFTWRLDRARVTPS